MQNFIWIYFIYMRDASIHNNRTFSLLEGNNKKSQIKYMELTKSIYLTSPKAKASIITAPNAGL